MKDDIPDHVKRTSRKDRMRALRPFRIAEPEHRLGLFEIGLFKYYLGESRKVLTQMRVSEEEVMRECNEQGLEYDDAGIVVVEYFEKRVRYSHIIYLVTLLESCLKEACVRLRNAVGPQEVPFNWNDLKGNAWSQCTKYLEAYARIKIKQISKNRIRFLHEVRNSIVHDGGKVAEDFLTKIPKGSSIKIRSGEIIVGDIYVMRMFIEIKAIAAVVERGIIEIKDRLVEPKLHY